MNEILERIARAIEPSTFTLPRINLYKGDYERAYSRARDVIAAMREPTGEMIDAGAETYGVHEVYIGGNLPVSVIDGQPSKAWRAMCDAALSDVHSSRTEP